jgi:hypothetical protein
LCEIFQLSWLARLNSELPSATEVTRRIAPGDWSAHVIDTMAGEGGDEPSAWLSARAFLVQ